MKKQLHIICTGLITLNLQLITHNSSCQNVGINNDGTNGEANTMLDVKGTDNSSSGFGLKVKNGSGSDLFVIRNDGNAGIGVTTPQNKLDVEGAAVIGTFNSGTYAAPTNGLLVQGTVGIGTVTPTAKLTVQGTATVDGYGNAIARYTANNQGGVIIGSITGNTAYIASNAASANGLRFFTNGSTSTVLQLTNTGNVGVGTSSPAQKLDVNGNIAVSGTTVHTSDIRYKQNVQPLEGALQKIIELNGVTYKWKQAEFPEKNFNSRTQIGVIAQEIEKTYPELVYTDNTGFKSVDYSHLTPVLIEAIKEQQQMIETLKSDNKVQNTENRDLRAQLEQTKNELDLRLKQVEEFLKTVSK